MTRAGKPPAAVAAGGEAQRVNRGSTPGISLSGDSPPEAAAMITLPIDGVFG